MKTNKHPKAGDGGVAGQTATLGASAFSGKSRFSLRRRSSRWMLIAVVAVHGIGFLPVGRPAQAQTASDSPPVIINPDSAMIGGNFVLDNSVNWQDRYPEGTFNEWFTTSNATASWRNMGGVAVTGTGAGQRLAQVFRANERFSVNHNTEIVLTFDFTPAPGASGNELKLEYWVAGWKLNRNAATGNIFLNTINDVITNLNGNAVLYLLAGTSQNHGIMVTGSAGARLSHENRIALPAGMTLADFDYLGLRFQAQGTASGHRLENVRLWAAPKLPDFATLNPLGQFTATRIVADQMVEWRDRLPNGNWRGSSVNATWSSASGAAVCNVLNPNATVRLGQVFEPAAVAGYDAIRTSRKVAVSFDWTPQAGSSGNQTDVRFWLVGWRLKQTPESTAPFFRNTSSHIYNLSGSADVFYIAGSSQTAGVRVAGAAGNTTGYVASWDLPSDLEIGDLDYMAIIFETYKPSLSGHMIDNVRVACDPGPVYRLHLASLHDITDRSRLQAAWDILETAASIQGLVNQDAPRLFLRCNAQIDDFWWNYLRKDHGWLANRDVVDLRSVAELLDRLSPPLLGVVLYNGQRFYESNIAMTMAGVERHFVLREDTSPHSLYSQLVAHPKFPATIKRVPHPGVGGLLDASGNIAGTTEPSTGSAKNDAYRWAIARYLVPGNCSATEVVYGIDAYWLKAPPQNPAFSSSPVPAGRIWETQLPNRDFFVARKAFHFDLNPLADAPPIDDPEAAAHLDSQTLRRLFYRQGLRASPDVYCVAGFVPWHLKYTNTVVAGNVTAGGTLSAWDSEKAFIKTLSAYNGYNEGDAGGIGTISNASFYQYFPRQAHYPQPGPDLSTAALQAAGLLDAQGRVIPRSYLAWYVGDYDAPSWLNNFLPKMWEDLARGTIPLNWAFNPNLLRRAPHAMHYARTKARPGDWFISGPSGAGYINPGMLSADQRQGPEMLPDGWSAWSTHCLRWFSQFGLNITGFVIDGSAPPWGPKPPAVPVGYAWGTFPSFSPGGVGLEYELDGDDPGWGYGAPAYVPYAHVDGIQVDGPMHLTTPSKAAEVIIVHILEKHPPQNGEPFFGIARTVLAEPIWHQRVQNIIAGHPVWGGDQVRFLSAPVFFELIRRAKAP